MEKEKLEELLIRISIARDAIMRKKEQSFIDYSIEGVLRDCAVALEEQKPVKPYRMNRTQKASFDNWKCGKCDENMYFQQGFCEVCGTQADWE